MADASGRFTVNRRLTIILLIGFAAPAVLIPAAVLGYILFHGLSGLVRLTAGGALASVLTEIKGQMIGSILLTGGACVIAFPVALGVALWLQQPEGRRWRRTWQILLHLLQGIPPLVYGLCGLGLLVHLFHWGISLAAGVVVLATVILPQLTLNCLAALQPVPGERIEAARCLGLSEAAVIRRVLLPGAAPGLITALLLAMARTLAETAPILFTAAVFSGIAWPKSLFSPVETLQTHVFYLAQEGLDQQAIDAAWVTAVVLILGVSVCSLAALRSRWHRR